MFEDAETVQRVAKTWLGAFKGAAVSKPWIDSVRKSWKRVVQEVLTAGAYEKIAKIQDALRWLDRFATDLAFSKGWYQPNVAESEGDTELHKIRRKAMSLVTETIAILKDGLGRLEFLDSVVTPDSHDFKMDGGRLHREFSTSPEGLERKLFNSLRSSATDTIDLADKAFSGKLLRHLMSVTNKWGPVDLEDGFELQFAVGRVNVTVEEFQNKGWRPETTPDPEARRRHHGEVTRAYVKQLSKAQALLERSGLGFLWYGDILLRCKSCGGVNALGAQFGVGGDYVIGKDQIRIYSDPVSGLHRLVLHEIGHRYYYKFMTPTDRARFDSDFGLVDATTPYGATISSEDFAEVFADYLLRKDLSSDQIKRFKQFLGRKASTNEPPVDAFVKGYLQRHAAMRKFVPSHVKVVAKTGTGPHGEARQHGNEIWLFQKFWNLDRVTQDWVFTHEIGHWILSDFGLAQLIKIAKDYSVDPWDSGSLPYGQHNAEEAFADCFAAAILEAPELKRRYPEWESIVAHVRSRGRVAGNLVDFRKTPTIKIQGRTFVLSTYGDAMGDAADNRDEDAPEGGARLIRMRPSNPWRYLWAYDPDQHLVAMWRVSDGDEKTAGRDSSFTRELAMLEKRKQLNRVDRASFDLISRYMRKQNDDTLESLRKHIEENASEEEKKIAPLLRDYFKKKVEPEFQKLMKRWESGVKPFGFKPDHDSAFPVQRQLASWTSHMVMKDVWTLDLLEKYVEDQGVNMALLGNQDVDFAMKDIWYEEGAELLGPYLGDIRTSAQRVANRWLRGKVDFSEFKKSIEGKKFLNPDTDNEVLFQSLPQPQQVKIFQDWKRRQGPQEKKREHARGLVPIDKKRAREVSDRLAENLVGMKFRDPEESLYHQRSQPWPVSMMRMKLESVKGQEYHVPIDLDIGPAPETNWTMNRKYVAKGVAQHKHLGEEHEGYPSKITITLNRDRTPAELEKDSKRVADEIYHVMIHELTHAVDKMKTPKQTDKRKQEDAAKSRDKSETYHNLPHEVRAFKRQIAEEVEDKMKELFDSEEDPDWIDHGRQIVETVLGSSKTWDRIRKDLTPENRKSVLKTIADVVRRYKEQRGGKTSSLGRSQ